MIRKRPLEALNDLEYNKKYDELCGSMRETLNRVLSKWVEEGVITELEKQKEIEDYEEKEIELFNYILG